MTMSAISQQISNPLIPMFSRLKFIVAHVLNALIGWPTPASGVAKQRAVAKYGREFGITTLIETGTFRGDMIESQKGNFTKLVTIELDRDLYDAAKERFKMDSRVTVLHGDSGTELAGCLKELGEPVLYWLDGHYSGEGTAKDAGETPIERELSAIADRNNPRDVILIDDARLFGRRTGYPPIPQLERFVSERLPAQRLFVEDDIICIVPR